MSQKFVIPRKLAIAASCALAVVTLVPAVRYAQAGTVTTTAAKQNQSQDQLRKLSQDGAKAFELIREGRLELFNGDTQGAEKSVKAAAESLDRAKKDDTAYMKKIGELKTLDGKHAAGDKSLPPMAWIPIDGSFSFDESFKATPQQQQQLKVAREHVKNNDMKKAAEVLKLADINFRAAVLSAPLEQSIGLVADASKLMASGKYFEANLKLKQIQDGVVLDINDEDIPVK